MKNSGAGYKHINNNLKMVLSIASFSNPNLSSEEIKRKVIMQFLDSKIMPVEIDPDKNWMKY